MNRVELKPFVKDIPNPNTHDVCCDGVIYGFVYRDPDGHVQMRFEPDFSVPSDEQYIEIFRALEAKYPGEKVHTKDVVWPESQGNSLLEKTFAARRNAE